MTRALLLGVDLGTSSVKVVAVGADGAPVASASAEYPTLQPHPGYAEQEPQAWWQATCVAARMVLASGVAPAEIRAIGLSGQMHGTVLLDAAGAPLGNAIIWQDRRSARQVQELTQQIGVGQLLNISGSALSTGFQAATLAWLRTEEPQRLTHCRAILLPKDWLRWRMTGALATDASDAAGTLLFDTRAEDWADALLAACGVRRATLPAIQPSAAVAGVLTEAAAQDLGLLAGTSVAVGGADTACSLLAAGAVQPDTLLLSLSTGGQLTQPVAEPHCDAKGRIHTFRSALPVESGAGWYQMGATLAAGMALRWLRAQVLGWRQDREEALLQRAAQIEAGADGLIFLPHLLGERTPHMDAQARGAFLGLVDGHDAGHLARAVLEGVTFGLLDAWQVLASLAAPASAIVLAGGGARAASWRQIVADVFVLPVHPLHVGEQSALGAALLAGGALGWWDVAAQARAWVRHDAPVLPIAANVQRYQALYAIYQEAWRANHGLFHQLHDFAHAPVIDR